MQLKMKRNKEVGVGDPNKITIRWKLFPLNITVCNLKPTRELVRLVTQSEKIHSPFQVMSDIQQVAHLHCLVHIKL